MKRMICGLLALIVMSLLLTGCSDPTDDPIQSDLTITLLAISGVTAPAIGATPVSGVNSAQYTGTVSWSPAVSGTFATSTVYTATITLTAKSGYTLSGVAANSFTVDGATSVTHSAGSAVVKAEFPSTSAAPVSLLAIPGVTAPAIGATPVSGVNSTQYTGTVIWSPVVSGTFASGTAYAATITLTPKSGYTLSGVAANSYMVDGATSVTHSASSGVVSAIFPSTATTITELTIPGITAPVHGVTPVTAITETAQYTGTVTWNGTPTTFAASMVYTATITLTAKPGFTLTGVAANSFTVAGVTSASNQVNSGVITVAFPITPSYVSATIGNMMAVAGGTFNNIAANMTVSSFRMSQHEVTGEAYAAVMLVADPSNFASVSNNPVEQVTWFDAVEFCNKLSTKEGLTPVYAITGRTPATGYPITAATVTANWTNNGYRLPTEAEWQFAALGGNRTNFFTYAGSNTIGDVAWYAVNAGNTTHTVGTKAANELGLYDMSGNVTEWCWDLYGSYPTTAQTDYRGAASGSDRVIRGGCWYINTSYCTVDRRDNIVPNRQDCYFGFRVVRP